MFLDLLYNKRDEKENKNFALFDFKKAFHSVPLDNIQKDLPKVEDWCNANKMKLNEGKYYILPKKQKEDVEPDFTFNSNSFQKELNKRTWIYHGQQIFMETKY